MSAWHLVLWIISLSFLRHYDSPSKARYPGMHVLNLLCTIRGYEYILLVNYSIVSGREKGSDWKITKLHSAFTYIFTWLSQQPCEVGIVYNVFIFILQRKTPKTRDLKWCAHSHDKCQDSNLKPCLPTSQLDSTFQQLQPEGYQFDAITGKALSKWASSLLKSQVV